MKIRQIKTQNADDAMIRENFMTIYALLDKKVKKFQTNEIKAKKMQKEINETKSLFKRSLK